MNAVRGLDKFLRRAKRAIISAVLVFGEQDIHVQHSVMLALHNLISRKLLLLVFSQSRDLAQTT
jgi:hypothetical protein